jgi:hypothetical protein
VIVSTFQYVLDMEPYPAGTTIIQCEINVLFSSGSTASETFGGSVHLSGPFRRSQRAGIQRPFRHPSRSHFSMG